MKRVVLFGCQQIAIDVLDYLSTLDDVEVSLVVSSELERDRLAGGASLAERAVAAGLKTRNPGKAAEVIDEVEEIAPDIILSLYYRKVLPPRLLEIPKLGCVNVHPGLLPQYRGPTPTAWAMLNGERSFGITIHRMDEGIDTGPILVQEEYEIDPEETGFELHLRAMQEGAQLLARNFDKILRREVKPKEQQGIGSYFGRLKIPYRIDWQDRAENIRNAIRTYARPFQPAETRLSDRTMLIDRATRLPDARGYLLQGPGRIVDVKQDARPVVSAADGFLLIEDYEFVPPIGKEEAKALLRAGARLGD